MPRSILRCFSWLGLSLFLTTALLPGVAQPGEKPEKKALSEGDTIRIGDRHYALRFFKNAVWGTIEKSGQLCLWKEGTAWVIDPLRPDLKDHFACPWPIETVAADRSLAVVRVPAKKDMLAVADVRKKTLIAEFPDAETKVFSSRYPPEWVFAKKCQHVYTLVGSAEGGWYYLDLDQKKLVRLKIPGFSPTKDYHLWNGALLDDGKEMVIFIAGPTTRDGRRRMQFPLEDIEKRTLAIDDIDVVSVLQVAKHQLTAYLGRGQYGVISTQTWKVIKRFDWGDEVRSPFCHRVGPGGRHAYFINDLHRLIVYERKTGALVKVFPEPKETDAHRLGVTFSADGRHGVVAAQAGQIVVFDSTTHEIVQQVAVKHPVGMAFLIEPAEKDAVGTCLVID